MRRSEVVLSSDELAKEHEEMREGLAPFPLRDLDNYFERTKADREKREGDRQKHYDRKAL